MTGKKNENKEHSSWNHWGNLGFIKTWALTKKTLTAEYLKPRINCLSPILHKKKDTLNFM